MKIKKNIALSDTGFVFDPSTGNSFTTNPIGLQIIQLLKQERAEADIKADLVKTYAVDVQTAERDLFDFMNVLNRLRLLE